MLLSDYLYPHGYTLLIHTWMRLMLPNSSSQTDPPPAPVPYSITHLLQSILPTLNSTLRHIIKTSLMPGTFPTLFKLTRVTPLLKKQYIASRKLQTSFSSLILSKTLEHTVLNQVSNFLSQNNLLDPNQSGFKSGYSTETALLAVLDSLKSARAADHHFSSCLTCLLPSTQWTTRSSCPLSPASSSPSSTFSCFSQWKSKSLKTWSSVFKARN